MVRDITDRKRAEDALRESKNRFRVILDTSPDVIHLLDRDGIILAANKGYAKRLGLELDDIIGRCVYDLMPSESISVRKAAINKVFSTGEPLQLEDKTVIGIFDSHIHPVFDPAEKVIAVSVFARDITKYKQAESIIKAERDLGLELSRASSLEETLKLCLDKAIEFSGLDCGGIYLVDDTTGGFDLAIHKGLAAVFVTNASHYDAGSPSAGVIMKQIPIYTQHKYLGTRTDKTHEEKLKAAAIMPVLYDSRVIACLNVASHTLDDVPHLARILLESLLSHIGIAIARSKAEDALNKYHDHLEEMIKQRTKKLEEQKEDLERMNRLFVGREFRIKELRDEVKELKREK